MRILYLLLLVPSIAFAAPQWDWSKKVTIKSNDVGQQMDFMTLKGGSELTVDISRIGYDEVDKWPEGKKLLMAYRPDVGVVLVDPATGKFIEVIKGLKPQENPIHLYAEACSQKDDCEVTEIDLWEKEIARLHRKLAQKYGNQKNASVFKAAQSDWDKLSMTYGSMISAAYSSDTTSGRQANQVQQLIFARGYAVSLSRLFETW